MTKKQVLAMLKSKDEPAVPDHLRPLILETRKLFAQFAKSDAEMAKLKRAVSKKTSSRRVASR